jgi:Na+-translocating ferredoxin:NAD+ oxidoreductase RnfG subunit
VKLTKELRKAIEKASGVRVRLAEQKVWRVTRAEARAGWFIVDEVIGKHEFITYALALNTDGSVKSVEVMDYRENYGSEIRRADWRRQFLGKRNGAKLELDEDIQNISGATLSCRTSPKASNASWLCMISCSKTNIRRCQPLLGTFVEIAASGSAQYASTPRSHAPLSQRAEFKRANRCDLVANG